MQYALGADIGTEGTKVLVIDERGRIVKRTYSSYTFDVPKSGWAEQNPEIWWNAFRSCLGDLWAQGISSTNIVAVGAAGQMHSSVLLDETGEAVMNSILWNDTRTKAVCDQTLRSVGQERYQTLTCNSLLPGFTLGKLLWVRTHAPEVYERIRHILMPKDFINHRLTGRWTADVSDASGTGIFDVRERRWQSSLMTELDLPQAWFPPVFESGAIIGSVTPAASDATGLRTGTAVIAGAADNAAAAVGMGIVDVGRGLISIGTSGVILSCLEEAPSPHKAATQNPTLHVFCHAIPEMWYAMGVTLAAGASLRWFRDSMGHGASYDSLMDAAAQSEPGSNGLIYLPFLAGERTPYNSDQLRAGFIGIDLQHKPAHFVRSVLEGVAYSLRDCLEVVQSLNQNVDNVDEFVVTGGVVNSPLWLQILSDVLDRPLAVRSYSEGAAYGAAALAGLSQGFWTHIDDLVKDQSGLAKDQPGLANDQSALARNQTDPSNERSGVEKLVPSPGVAVYREGYKRYKAYAQSFLHLA